MKYEEIEEFVKSKLSEYRFYHSQCVAKQCEELASFYKIETNKAKLVGITHDIAKEMPKEEMMEYIEKNQIFIDDVEKQHPKLLHAKIGADICKKQFGFDDEMTEAISAHTTGKKHMGLLSKILFIADATGDDRTWEDVDMLRKLAKENINLAVLYILDMNIKERIDEKKLIHTDSIFCRNELLILQ